jgi:glucose/arabinose dehydrogenase
MVKINAMKSSVILAPLLLLTAHASAASIADLKVDPRYKVEVYADKIDGARSMTQGSKGTLFIGTRDDKVYALKDHKLYTIAEKLNMPNGVAFKDGTLYVAEVSRIIKFENIEANLSKPPKPVVVYDQLPTEKHHGWKFIAFGPDGFLYVPVGAPCNICNKESEDKRFASIMRFKKLDGSAPEVFSHGIRNTVGFDWNPKTKVLWFTENGRDMLGDDVPSDELNHAPKIGMHFGYPFCHQGDTLDPEFGKGKKCSGYTGPDLKLGAHVAALGMRFVDENTILIAEHGSWNRSGKVGYQVVHITLANGKAIKSEPILSGFLQKSEKVVGRPVDIEILADRSILVSDDDSGAIYRLTANTSKH